MKCICMICGYPCDEYEMIPNGGNYKNGYRAICFNCLDKKSEKTKRTETTDSPYHE